MTRFIRQETLIPDQALQKRISLIGLGGIGSWAYLALMKMGVRSIETFDPDIVEEHNVTSQAFPQEKVGGFKVRALEALRGLDLFPSATKFPKMYKAASEVIISAVDSMESRKEIFKSVKPLMVGSSRPGLYLDGRMGAEVGILYSVKKVNIEKYLETLHTDEEGVEGPCTARATVYCGMGMGALICATVKKHLVGEEVPFLTMVDFRNLLMLQPK